MSYIQSDPQTTSPIHHSIYKTQTKNHQIDPTSRKTRNGRTTQLHRPIRLRARTRAPKTKIWRTSPLFAPHISGHICVRCGPGLWSIIGHDTRNGGSLARPESPPAKSRWIKKIRNKIFGFIAYIFRLWVAVFFFNILIFFRGVLRPQ